MSKDPAFLFYSSDFFMKTMLMTDEQVGKYIRLLCSQHQNGHLTKEDMLKICKTYDEDIFRKFDIDENGLYYNERLDKEINRRVAYSESRRQNRTTTKPEDMKNICKSYEKHMEIETIDINKGGVGGNRFVKPTLEEVTAYCLERNKGVNPQKWIDHYESNGWMVGRVHMKDWRAAVRKWEPDIKPATEKYKVIRE
jgi:uncharacterized protein YdaU (DUF1376 family)